MSFPAAHAHPCAQHTMRDTTTCNTPQNSNSTHTMPCMHRARSRKQRPPGNAACSALCHATHEEHAHRRHEDASDSDGMMTRHSTPWGQADDQGRTSGGRPSEQRQVDRPVAGYRYEALAQRAAAGRFPTSDADAFTPRRCCMPSNLSMCPPTKGCWGSTRPTNVQNYHRDTLDRRAGLGVAKFPFVVAQADFANANDSALQTAI